MGRLPKLAITSRLRRRSMGYLVYINDNEAWCASSLRAAQLLAEGFICDLKKLRIVSENESKAERSWSYDYHALQWVEEPGGAA